MGGIMVRTRTPECDAGRAGVGIRQLHVWCDPVLVQDFDHFAVKSHRDRNLATHLHADVANVGARVGARDAYLDVHWMCTGCALDMHGLCTSRCI